MESTWRFEVTGSFVVRGRGLAVMGNLTGAVEPRRQAAAIHVKGRTTRTVQATREFLQSGEGPQPVLLLAGVGPAEVPAGAVLTPATPPPG